MINNSTRAPIGAVDPKTLWFVTAIGVTALMIGGIFWTGSQTGFVHAGADAAEIVVYKTPNCGCCHNWITYLREHGLKVAEKNVATTQPVRAELGVPAAMTSCHTGVVDNYWFEGHVPADLVQRILTERPDDIAGIAVPGMPIGSPGMEAPNPVTYDVVAYHKDGTVSVYATRDGKTTSH